ncbi:MAG TPA: PEP-CTERM sorting domain-containing protein [Phycisphaerae bacterium]|nr:PEP-CTERM sorting domain-containing protein [Phycisphaerae bacterium]
MYKSIRKFCFKFNHLSGNHASMNIRCLICLSGVLFAMLRSASGQSSYETWTFDGIITKGLPGSPYQVNVPYSVYFDVDTSRLATTATGLYFPTGGYGFDANSSGFGASSVGSGVLIANDQPTSGGGSFDGIIFSMFGEQSTGFPSGTLFDGSAFGITLVNSSEGPTATPFSDTSFPSTLDLNQFSQRYMTVYFQSGAVMGSVDSLYLNGILISQVPEPSVLGLFTLGGLLFGMWVKIDKQMEAASYQPCLSLYPIYPASKEIPPRLRGRRRGL